MTLGYTTFGYPMRRKYVTPLCQAFLKLLTGKNTALFLPCYAFSTMTDAQISQHFSFHEKWHRSLSSILIGPTVTHLDQPRTEYCEDGTVLVQSVRAWALAMVQSDGKTPALCGVVNGTPDRKAYLVVPKYYMEMAQTQWRQYRLRLFPLRQQEVRYRDTVLGLPDVIHITTSIQSNADCRLQTMSAAEVWSQAPSSVRESPPLRASTTAPLRVGTTRPSSQSQTPQTQ
jgi:hypothetical protein